MIIWLLTISLSASSLIACAQVAATGSAMATAKKAVDPGKEALMQPMRQMMAKIKKLQATGDPDFDYGFQVKIHTQGEIDLLKEGIASVKDTNVKKMAEDLLKTAQADQATIDATLKQLRPARPNQAFAQAQSRNIEAMALKLQSGGTEDKLTGDYDKNFVTVLLEHRQDAIDLAKTYLQYGNNNTLKNYAQKLVTQAQLEMEQAKAMPK